MLVSWTRYILLIVSLICASSVAIDVCNLYDVPLYCTCEPTSKGQTITCFIFGSVSSFHEVWPSFSEEKDVLALTISSRLPVQIDFIPQRALQSLPKLETLIVQEAKLGSVTAGTISNMTNLRDLRLERNEITALERYSISNLPRLKTLILSENSLTEILADSLFNLSELEKLYLDRNNVTRIESCAFCSLQSLLELELWSNMITDLTEHMFRGLRYLTRLDLSKNQVRILNDKVFQSLPKLKELELWDNEIEYVSTRAFYGLQELQRLILSGNKLKSLPDQLFWSSPNLMIIDLSSNLLETVQEEVVSKLPNMKNRFFGLVLKDNPLRCSCDLKWMHKYSVKTKSREFSRDLQNLTCLQDSGKKQFIQTLKLDKCERKKVPSTVATIISSIPTDGAVGDSEVSHSKDDLLVTVMSDTVSENGSIVIYLNPLYMILCAICLKLKYVI